MASSKNIRMARELVRLARSLVAFTFSPAILSALKDAPGWKCRIVRARNGWGTGYIQSIRFEHLVGGGVDDAYIADGELLMKFAESIGMKAGTPTWKNPAIAELTPGGELCFTVLGTYAPSGSTAMDPADPDEAKDILEKAGLAEVVVE